MITPEQVKAKTPERFWSKIKFGKPDECWEWQRGLSDRRYGKYKNKRNDGTWSDISTHRFIYERLFGNLSEGMMALHTCDNKKCVNPNHLFSGTSQDNVDDMVNKGRNAFGSNHGKSVLDEDIVRVIKTRLFAGETQKSIAEALNLNKFTIGNIALKRTWNHVVVEGTIPKKTAPYSKLTANDVRLIKIRLRSGETVASLGREYGVVHTTISKIKRNENWAHIIV